MPGGGGGGIIYIYIYVLPANTDLNADVRVDSSMTDLCRCWIH